VAGTSVFTGRGTSISVIVVAISSGVGVFLATTSEEDSMDGVAS
jgi:hypothetical protein